MSLVLCVGQAGNQLGGAVARRTGPLHEGAAGGGFVFVDSEPKVVRSLLPGGGGASPLTWLSLPACAWDAGGRGNNWAWGYTGGVGAGARSGGGGGGSGGVPLWKRAMATVRRQAEACGGTSEGIVVLHSMGGGTGAGLGSRLLEACREDFPKATLLSACVAPFAAGDSPLQHYNMALTLAAVGEAADALLFLDNDDLLRRARARRAAAASAAASAGAYSRGGGASAADGRAGLHTAEVNEVAAEALAGLLLPTWHRGRRRRRLRQPAAATGADGDGSSNNSCGRPAWVDVREERAPVRARAATAAAAGVWDGRWDSEDEDEAAAAAAEAMSAAVSGGGAFSGLTPALFDCSDLVRELVVAPRLKLLDVRSFSDAPPPLAGEHGPLGGGPRLVATPWGELADALAGELPRFHASYGDREPVAARAAPTLTLAARLIARGASQADCDAVDPDTQPPALPLQTATAPARGGAGARLRRPTPMPPETAWPGVPATDEWRTVSMKLRRSLHLGARSADATRLPLSAVLSPAFGPASSRRTLTTACASDVATPRLLYCVERVDSLIHRRAYVHWYEKFGVEADDLRAAAEALLDTVDAYAAVRREIG